MATVQQKRTMKVLSSLVTQSPLRFSIHGPLDRDCLELCCSLHPPTPASLRHSHTSASSLQGVDTFQESMLLPLFIWPRITDTDTFAHTLRWKPSWTTTQMMLELILFFSHLLVRQQTRVLLIWRYAEDLCSCEKGYTKFKVWFEETLPLTSVLEWTTLRSVWPFIYFIPPHLHTHAQTHTHTHTYTQNQKIPIICMIL